MTYSYNCTTKSGTLKDLSPPCFLERPVVTSTTRVWKEIPCLTRRAQGRRGFFLGQVNCQFKHLLSQIGWKRSGRRGRSLLWPRLQGDLSGYWSRREQETHGCDRISGPPTANPVIRMQLVVNTATHSTTAKPIAQSPLKPRTAFSHCPLVIQPQWLVWTCDDHSSVHINCLMNN